jgi:hypothetical protein
MAFRRSPVRSRSGPPTPSNWVTLGYRDGLGVPRSQRIAAKWLRVSAEAGNADAQNDLGYCLHEGLGVRKDRSLRRILTTIFMASLREVARPRSAGPGRSLLCVRECEVRRRQGDRVHADEYYVELVERSRRAGLLATSSLSALLSWRQFHGVLTSNTHVRDLPGV